MDKYHKYVKLFPKGVPKNIDNIPYDDKWSFSTKPQEYEILKFLGRGAYGSTYIVQKHNRKYVMKKISLAKSKIPDILLEVQALKKISKYNNCNIEQNISSLCLIDDFVDYENNEYVIITNYLENSITLSTFLAKYKELDKKMNLDDIVFIMSRLISQLDKLHNYGVVHNDIKPDNIIIQYINDKITNVLFIDFGVSCIKLCRPSGTILYLAPELFRIISHTPESVMILKEKLLSKEETQEEGEKIPINKSDYMKTDVFSLGMVFYEMLHNKYPYPYKLDYIRDKSKYYKEYPIDFELSLMDLKVKNESLFEYINKLSYTDTDTDTDTDSFKLTPEEKEEHVREDKIRAYINENLPPLLSPESLISYYDYYKTNPRFISLYTEDESGSPEIAKTINDLVEKMLIVNPLNRPSIHRIKSKFGRVIIQLLSKNFFTSVTKRQLISPTYQETNQ
jgi:serine/threonine protein kinase